MENKLSVTTERIDDFVLLLHIMMRLELPQILDRHLSRHWLEQGLRWGWVASIWLAHILSQGDHRKLTVRDWVRQAHDTLERVTGLSIRDTDFTDDRLTILLRKLSALACWHAIEQELGCRTIRVYALEQQRVRLDATTVSGYHQPGVEGTAQSLFRFGKSKDTPDLPQVKVMMATLDPLGQPLAIDVVSGEKADDGLYRPLIERMLSILTQPGLLFVGDSKITHTVGTRSCDPCLSAEPGALLSDASFSGGRYGQRDEHLDRAGTGPDLDADLHAQFRGRRGPAGPRL